MGSACHTALGRYWLYCFWPLVKRSIKWYVINENLSLPHLSTVARSCRLSGPPGKLFRSLPPPVPLSYSLDLGQVQESAFLMNPSRWSMNWQILLWNMLKKPDQMLGDSPLPPRDRFMVWVKTMKNILVFSLVSLWVSASRDTKWNHTEPGSLDLRLPHDQRAQN